MRVVLVWALGLTISLDGGWTRSISGTSCVSSAETELAVDVTMLSSRSRVPGGAGAEPGASATRPSRVIAGSLDGDMRDLAGLTDSVPAHSGPRGSVSQSPLVEPR